MTLQRLHVGIAVILQRMQMNGAGSESAVGKAGKPCFAAFGERSQTRAAFAQRPLEQGIVAAGNDRQWLARGQVFWPMKIARQPVIKLIPGKQPFACHLGAGNGAFSNQLIDLAFFEPEIIGSFRRRQESHGLCAVMFCL